MHLKNVAQGNMYFLEITYFVYNSLHWEKTVYFEVQSNKKTQSAYIKGYEKVL